MAGWFEGKVALITGASAGIGRAAALVFAREEAMVVVSDVDVRGGEGTANKITEAGGEAVWTARSITLGLSANSLPLVRDTPKIHSIASSKSTSRACGSA